MHMLVAVLSDSRGGELVTHIKRVLPRNVITKGFSIPAGGIGKLLVHAKRTINRFRKDFPSPNKIFLVISGGIYDLTSKDHESGELYYQTTENKAEQLISQLEEVLKYCATAGCELILPNLVPVSLVDANNLIKEKGGLTDPAFTPKEIQLQQTILLNDIDSINDAILEGAHQGLFRRVNMYRNFLKRCNYAYIDGKIVLKKSDNPDFRKLVDGFHFNDALQQIYYNKIAAAVKFSIDRDSLPGFSIEESEDTGHQGTDTRSSAAVSTAASSTETSICSIISELRTELEESTPQEKARLTELKGQDTQIAPHSLEVSPEADQSTPCPEACPEIDQSPDCLESIWVQHVVTSLQESHSENKQEQDCRMYSIQA
jgi:hypothetical protein